MSALFSLAVIRELKANDRLGREADGISTYKSKQFIRLQGTRLNRTLGC